MRVRGRIIVLFYICALLFFILSIRLVNIQAFENTYFKDLALKQHTGKIQIACLRGQIFDSKGVLLAKSLELPSLACNPSEIKDPKTVANLLSPVLNIKEQILFKKATSKGTFVWIKRKIDHSLAQKVEDLELKGIFLLKESAGKRFYPKGKLASHILGYAGIDDQGLDGLELAYDKYLRGKPGNLEAEIDNFGRAIPQGRYEIVPPKNGYNVTLTIDETLQFIAETQLEKAIKKYKAKKGTCIIANVNTGEILALANKPDFYCNKFATADTASLRNQAISDSFEPGSIFKVFLAAAALDSEKVNLKEKFYCKNSITVGGWDIYNANDGLYSKTGKENLTEIITYSFNVGAASVALKLGKSTFYKYIKDFGFGEYTKIDLPGESSGIVSPSNLWSDSALATISFGQGISVTPVQIITAICAVANGGILYTPRIVKRITDSKQNVIKEFLPQKKRRVISFKTSMKLNCILRQVVERGTAKSAQIDGYQVAGKTGTAQVVEDGHYSSNRYIASFVGFVPAEDPKIAILVKIEEPKGSIWGGVVAAPVFKEVAQLSLWHLGIPPSLPTK